ncbi:MAG TPA: ABC transporter permease subunit [Gaiellales bacterium]|jgi:ABC-2 type transport system permease protein
MSTDARVADVAYSRYDGPRSGRLGAIWSLARWSALRALGARRGWKAKLIPITLTLLAFAPALVILGLRALFGTSSLTTSLVKALPYSDYSTATAIVILVFGVVITPELVCPDRRDRTLSLYFSTAISRGDYVAGKILAALMPLLLVTLAPPLILYAGNLLFAVHPLGYLDKHAADILRIIGSGLVIGVFYALVGLAISSLSARRAFAVGGYLAFLAIPTIIGGVLAHAINERYLRLLAFAAAPIQTARGFYPGYTDRGHISAGVWGATSVELMVVALAVLAIRYGRDTG